MLTKFLITAIGLYLLGLVLLMLFQRGLMYFPDPNLPAPPRSATQVDIEGRPAWYRAPAEPDAPIYLFFHGNAGNLAYFWPVMQQLTADGAGLLMPEYPGYGGARGPVTEATLIEAGEAAYRLLRAQGVAPARIILYGLSLGSGVAVQLAHRQPAAGLILEAPFSSALDIARWRFPIYPVDWVMQDRFDSLALIGEVHLPLLVIHGTADRVIPYRFGQRLFAAANSPKTMLTVEGAGHNDLFEQAETRRAVALFSGEVIARSDDRAAAE